MTTTSQLSVRSGSHRREGSEHDGVAAAAPSRRVAGLDGLRAVAVIAVVAFHAAPGLVPGGYVGVDVFFVISGFLITRNLLVGGALTRSRLRRFWTARARRLLPALALVLLVVTPLTLLVGGDAALTLRAQLWGAVSFTSNWVTLGLLDSYFAANQPVVLKHLWSLAVEEQFYLLWPLVVVLLLRMSARTRVLLVGTAAATSAALMVILMPSLGVDRVYFGTDTHAFGLLLGAVVAFSASTRRPRTTPHLDRLAGLLTGGAALAVLVWCVVSVSGDAGVLPIGLLASTLATGVLIESLLRSPAGLGRLLDRPVLRAVGRRSYGLYLWHWPLLVLAGELTVGDGAAVRGAVTVVALALAAGAAWASYACLERPVMEGRVPLLPVAPRGRLAVATVVATAVVATAVAGVRPPAPSDGEARVEAGRDFLQDRAELAGHQTDEEPGGHRTGGPRGRRGAPPDARCSAPVQEQEVTGIGDSVMLASAPGLTTALPRVQIDAAVSRQPTEGPDIARRLAAEGRLADTVVLGLGTNGTLTREVLDQVRDAIGDRRLVVVGAHGDRSWIEDGNREIADYAADHPRVAVADWDAAISGHDDLLASDGIHPDATGGRLYGETVRDAVRELGPLPGCPGATGEGAPTTTSTTN